jgi:hypothetical protein
MKGIIYGLRPNQITTSEHEDNGHIEGYTDVNWAGDTFINRSTTEYVFMNAEKSIVWKSKKQSVVALFTCETEYIAASNILYVVTWLHNLLDEIKFIFLLTSLSIPLAIDNQRAIALIKMNGPNCHGTKQRPQEGRNGFRTKTRKPN